MGGHGGGGGRSGRSGGGGGLSTESAMDSYAEQVFSGLSPVEARSIEAYQTGDYAAITHRLVTGETDRSADRHIAQLDAVMKRSKTPVDATVYRGMSVDAANKVLGKNPKEGKTIKMKNFASTSLSKDISSKFGWSKSSLDPRTPQHLLEIKAPKGTKGVYMKNNFEKELLLNRGTKLKVIGSRTETYMAKDYKGANLGTTYLKVTTVEVVP